MDNLTTFAASDNTAFTPDDIPTHDFQQWLGTEEQIPTLGSNPNFWASDDNHQEPSWSCLLNSDPDNHIPPLFQPTPKQTTIEALPQNRPFHEITMPRTHLPRRKSKYSLNQRSARPLDIPTTPSPGIGLDPMERWHESPPETEAASFSAIFDALRNAPDRSNDRISRGRQTASTTSFDSGTSASSNSIASTRSSRSVNLTSLRRSMSSGRVSRSRREAVRADKKRIFLCTFCCDSFAKKHDWMRHEKSLHLNLDQWVCAPFGGTVVSPATSRNHCAYCNRLDPTLEHLQGHNHGVCHTGQQPHIFRRKDHLVQHLKGFHNLDTLPIIDGWKIEPPVVVSRCGFCSEKLHSWHARADHITAHFKKGKTMTDWKGDHGFDPEIAARVTNALPPYLLAAETKTLVPFSATDPRTPDHMSQIFQASQMSHLQQPQVDDHASRDTRLGPGFELTPNTYTKYLAWHLGRFAQQSIAGGVFPTDDMFQEEARRLLYGDKDGWEQTIVDNGEWLAEFRRQHLDQ